MNSSTSIIAASFPHLQQQLGAENTVITLRSCDQLQPFITSWWARAINFKSFEWLNYSEMSWPKEQPAPLGEIPHPHLSSGSDQSRSQMGPSCGTSMILSSCLIQSSVSMLGERPPCKQKILLSTTAVRGRQSKNEVKDCHTFAFPYFLKHSSQKPQTYVICLLSWFPRSIVIRFGQRTFRQTRRVTVSTEQQPRSTQSPMNRQLFSGNSPPILKSSFRSQN